MVQYWGYSEYRRPRRNRYIAQQHNYTVSWSHTHSPRRNHSAWPCIRFYNSITYISIYIYSFLNLFHNNYYTISLSFTLQIISIPLDYVSAPRPNQWIWNTKYHRTSLRTVRSRRPHLVNPIASACIRCYCYWPYGVETARQSTVRCCWRMGPSSVPCCRKMLIYLEFFSSSVPCYQKQRYLSRRNLMTHQIVPQLGLSLRCCCRRMRSYQ